MQHFRHAAGLILLGSLLASASGCGKDEERLEVHPVKGVVLYNKEPMKGGGSINFFPTQPGGRAASAFIQEDGTFTLESYKGGDGAGAAAGVYKVVVIQTTTKEGAASTGGEEGGGESEETVEKKYQIPAIYNDQLRTPLEVTIEAGGSDLKIELKTNPLADRGA